MWRRIGALLSADASKRILLCGRRSNSATPPSLATIVAAATWNGSSNKAHQPARIDTTLLAPTFTGSLVANAAQSSKAPIRGGGETIEKPPSRSRATQRGHCLFLGRSIAVRLLPCRNVYVRVGELVGVPGRLGFISLHKQVWSPGTQARVATNVNLIVVRDHDSRGYSCDNNHDYDVLSHLNDAGTKMTTPIFTMVVVVCECGRIGLTSRRNREFQWDGSSYP
jgi:hypothetical protein